MNKLIVAALVLLAAVGQVSVSTAQVVSAPAPTATNSQGLPWWFVKHRYTPGMPWFYRTPGAPGRGRAGSRPGIRRSSRAPISGATR